MPDSSTSNVSKEEMGEAAHHIDDRAAQNQASIDRQQMHGKPFTIWTAMGLGHSITNSAVGIIVGLGNALPFGGPPVLFWGFILSAFAGLCVAISLGELASAFPHSGGQYYWVGTLAPPRSRRFLSYMIGFISWASGLCVSASVALVVIQATVACIKLAHPSFPDHPWIVFVGYQIVNLLAFGFNFFEKVLPWVSKSLLIYTPGIIFATFVALLAAGSEKQSVEAVFVRLSNLSGWPNGIAFLIGLNPSAWAFSCLDAVVHLADEIPQPRKNIPYALLCTVALGFCTGLPIVLVFMFCTVDLEAATSSTTPSLEIFLQVYKSKTAAIALESLPIVSSWGALIGAHTWQSRMAWAFSRDHGFPFHNHLSRVARSPFHAPVWAHVWSNLRIAVLGCLYLASKLAFNSLVAGGILFQYITYSASILCLLYHGRSKITPGPFWFPKLGLFANFFIISWSLTLLVFFCFPYFVPVEAGVMNYVSCVLVIVVLLALGYWMIHGKRSYKIADAQFYD